MQNGTPMEDVREEEKTTEGPVVEQKIEEDERTAKKLEVEEKKAGEHEKMQKPKDEHKREERTRSRSPIPRHAKAIAFQSYNTARQLHW